MCGRSVGASIPEELVIFAHFGRTPGQHQRRENKWKTIPNEYQDGDHVSSWVEFNYVGFATPRSVAGAN